MSQAQPSWSPNTGRDGEMRSGARYDVPAAHARLMVSAACPFPLAETFTEPTGVAAGEEAGRELDALCVGVVLDPQASRDIALLVSDRGLTTGALAFGCLLHLAGEEAAGFWWEFAAGAGELKASYLLMLDHKRRAELRDEVLWRDRLTAELDPARPASRPVPDGASSRRSPTRYGADWWRPPDTPNAMNTRTWATSGCPPHAWRKPCSH